VGINAKIGALDPDSGLLYVISQTAGKGVRGANGQLQVFRDAEMTADVKVGDYPRAARFSSDRKTLFLISETQLTTLPTSSFQVASITKTVPYMHDMAVSPDGARAYFFLAREDAYCCGVTTWDLAQAKIIKSATLGSKGARFAQALLALADSVSSYQTNKAAAKAAGDSSFYYSTYTPKVASAGRGVLHVRRDGSSVYALDPHTGYLTHIDPASGEVVKNIPLKGSAYEIVPVGESKTLLTVGEKGVGVIDIEKDAMTEEWLLGEGEKIKVLGVGMSPDGRTAIVLSNAGSRGISNQARLLPLIEGSKRIVDYLFLN
jgi:hypothetical protein